MSLIALPPVVRSLLPHLARVLWWPRRPGAVEPGLPQPDGADTDGAEADPGVEAPWFGNCGWFDSSHELNQGLQVQELDSPEALAAALPLGVWLDRQLAAR